MIYVKLIAVILSLKYSFTKNIDICRLKQDWNID